jgi:chromate transport protein ChrA
MHISFNTAEFLAIAVGAIMGVMRARLGKRLVMATASIHYVSLLALVFLTVGFSLNHLRLLLLVLLTLVLFSVGAMLLSNLIYTSITRKRG